MEQRNDLIIVVDAGHGGWDNGASWEGRLEKDDNLRLALEVQKQFRRQCINVIMTRDTDVFVELSDRAEIANRARADLFISLHRNSYIEQTPYTNGVENFIYLSAPEETTGLAARLVLEEVVNVGVQSNRGVSRGNYYVVRRTLMPAMLLEMGFIINEEDNRLFDEHLVEYAKAIVRGALLYFEIPYGNGAAVPKPLPSAVVPSPLPPSPVGPPLYRPIEGAEGVFAAQRTLNQYYDSDLLVDGDYGPKTRSAAIAALKITINNISGTNFTINDALEAQVLGAIPEFAEGGAGEGVALIQALLAAKGYDAGEVDGVYGPKTKAAVQMYQRDDYLTPDGTAGPLTIERLIR